MKHFIMHRIFMFICNCTADRTSCWRHIRAEHFELRTRVGSKAIDRFMHDGLLDIGLCSVWFLRVIVDVDMRISLSETPLYLSLFIRAHSRGMNCGMNVNSNSAETCSGKRLCNASFDVAETHGMPGSDRPSDRRRSARRCPRAAQLKNVAAINCLSFRRVSA